MITTRGFRDIIHIGRHQRPHHYSIQQEIPWQDRPLVKRRYRKVVTERIAPPRGEIVTPLDEEEVRAQAQQLKAAGVDSIAICFLFSYLNPAHESRAKEIVQQVRAAQILKIVRRFASVKATVTAANDQTNTRERISTARHAAGIDVGMQVIDCNQRDVQGQAKCLGGNQSDQQRASQTWGVCDSDSVYVR